VNESAARGRQGRYEQAETNRETDETLHVDTLQP
jgi:hypothetical protein